MDKVKRQNRVEYLDVAKGISMLCVILAHFPVPDIPMMVNRVCFSFHMPIFFLISGYLFKPRDMKTLAMHKSRQLLSPYFFTVIAVIAFSVCFTQLLGNDMSSMSRVVQEWLWAGFYGSGNSYSDPFWIAQIGAIWFLPAMFFAVLLFNYCIGQKYAALWVVALVLLGEYTKNVVWLPFSVQASLLSLGYMLIGYEVRQKELLVKAFGTPTIIISAFCLWVFYLICDGGQLYLVRGYWGKGIVYEIIFSTAAALVVLCISFFLSIKTNFLKRVLSFYGQHSLIVLCAHLVELNTFRWDILINRLENRGIIHSSCILITYSLKVMWATAVCLMIQWINRKRKEARSASKQTQTMTIANVRNEKDRYIDFTRGVAFLFVILGHLPIQENMRIIIFSFHVPIFCMLLGCLFAKNSSRSVIYKEILQLLFAYIGFRFLFLIGTLWKDIFYYGGNGGIEIIRDHLLSTAFGMSFASSILSDVYSVGYIWAMICFLFVLFLGIFLFNIIKNEKVRGCVAFFVSIFGIYIGKNVAYLPFSFDVAMVCVMFLYIGYLFQSYSLAERMDHWWILTVLAVIWMIQIQMGGGRACCTKLSIWILLYYWRSCGMCYCDGNGTVLI